MVNGRQKVGEWPYGYASFHFDVTSYLNPDGREQWVMVRLEKSSVQLAPGILVPDFYRNVHLATTDSLYVPVWGVNITTPYVKDDLPLGDTHIGDSVRRHTAHVLTTEINQIRNGISSGRMSGMCSY